jgi:glutathione peroxidase
MNNSIYDYKVKDINGEEVSLSKFSGKVLLIVNVASKCGFTPQYKGLEEIYQKFKGEVVVMGFPCNQFGHQEPGNAEEIKNFCSLNYDVKFPLFEKIDVNGANAHPLYGFLKESKPGLLGTEAIKWNFTKFLVNKKGEVVKRYAPNDAPSKIESELAQYL